jgi:hypothetical protein
LSIQGSTLQLGLWPSACLHHQPTHLLQAMHAREETHATFRKRTKDGAAQVPHRPDALNRCHLPPLATTTSRTVSGPMPSPQRRFARPAPCRQLPVLHCSSSSIHHVVQVEIPSCSMARAAGSAPRLFGFVWRLERAYPVMFVGTAGS